MSFSRYNSSLTLSGLQSKPENQYLERKGRDAKAAKIANELIGMLNAGGGVLVYGIADDGTVEDLRHSTLGEEIPHDLDPYRKLVHDLILPPAQIEREEIYLDSGQLIFLYHVEPNYERIYQRSGSEEVYLRIADSNRKLGRAEVQKLEYNKALRSFEEELAYKRRLADKKDGQFIFNNAAILLFAKDPERYIANASVRYVRHAGTERKSGDKFNVIKDQRFETHIPGLIRKLQTFVEASLRDYYYLDIKQGRFFKVPEFPEDAWLEGIVNALCHRSYNIQGNPVMIRHYDDRIEISNSGPLPAQVTVENIERERYSRNPRLARVLVEMGYVRELNEGVPRIYSAMAEFMLAKPEYQDTNGTVTLTLRNKVSDHKETILAEVLEQIEQDWQGYNESQHSIIEHLFLAQEATVQELIQVVGVGEKAIRNNLRKLEDAGVTERVSDKIRDPNAIYRFRNG